eukprot:12532060-Ditylum_brightwellii.AAC.1
MEDSDTLRETNRDALAPATQEGRGFFLMPHSASSASKDIRQGISGIGDRGHTSVRKHDTTKNSSTRKKC